MYRASRSVELDRSRPRQRAAGIRAAPPLALWLVESSKYFGGAKWPPLKFEEVRQHPAGSKLMESIAQAKCS